MPTLKQKMAAKKILENPAMPLGQAMREVGYDEATATHPKDLTESKGWKELMEKFLPDEKLFKKHDQALEAIKIVTSPTGPDTPMPDYAIQLKAVELGYKVKRYLGPESQINNQFNAQDMKVEFGGGE